MEQEDRIDIYTIPPNFTEEGTLLSGRIKTRNGVETYGKGKDVHWHDRPGSGGDFECHRSSGGEPVWVYWELFSVCGPEKVSGAAG